MLLMALLLPSCMERIESVIGLRKMVARIDPNYINIFVICSIFLLHVSMSLCIYMFSPLLDVMHVGAMTYLCIPCPWCFSCNVG